MASVITVNARANRFCRSKGRLGGKRLRDGKQFVDSRA